MPWIKTLFVAVFGLFIANTNGAQAPQTQTTIFDLPADTPGLMTDKQNQSVCGKMKECVHVIVPESRADEMINADNGDGGWNAAINCDGNIYFPADGTQPTTEEAVEYSCANVDNRENSPITEWYMKMFGYNYDAKTSVIKAGFARGSQAVCEIINFDLVASPKAGAKVMTVNERNCFWAVFRKIASNPIGRLLLYRLLIEIRRGGSNGGSVGDDVAYKPVAIIQNRNNCRCINILCHNSNSFVYSDKGCSIRFYFNDNMRITTVSEEYGNSSNRQYRTIASCKRSSDIGLFHEMIHWFHRLRHIIRYSHESSGFSQDNFSEEIKYVDRPNIMIGAYYYGNIPSDSNANQRRNVSARIWSNSSNNVNYEEIRTILGVTSELDGYLAGDEISENLYRLYTSSRYMRFGHSQMNYYEDQEILDRAKTTSESFDIDGKNHSFVYTKDLTNKPSLSYSLCPRVGLGACRQEN